MLHYSTQVGGSSGTDVKDRCSITTQLRPLQGEATVLISSVPVPYLFVSSSLNTLLGETSENLNSCAVEFCE
ncbi:hypothetical protein Ddc_19242 [Ditylenchus destructor]|nr:hypothetical protein Ddc_19242 [Ditylenchus destructor]